MKHYFKFIKFIFVKSIFVFLLLFFAGCSDERYNSSTEKIILGELNYYGEIVLPWGELSDFTFVNNELWVFYASDDSHEEFSVVYRYEVDTDNNSYNYIGEFKHNFGHCNTVDYCSKTDTLVMGNGGIENDRITDQIYIIENASALSGSDKVNLYDVAKIIDIDGAGLDFGRQLNVCWGESNNGSCNIIYALSNMNGVKYIRKLLLGRGSTILDYGKPLTAGENEFNGTFKIVNEFSKKYSSFYCNQGTQYNGGRLYEALGHDGLMIASNSLLNDGSVATEIVHSYTYNDKGEVSDKAFSEGIAIKTGYMFVGLNDYYHYRKILIYKM